MGREKKPSQRLQTSPTIAFKVPIRVVPNDFLDRGPGGIDPGSLPRLLLPFGGYGGVHSYPTPPAAVSASREDEHPTNTIRSGAAVFYAGPTNGSRSVRAVSASELAERYFTGRSDGLRPSGFEYLLVGSRR